jgi:integrase
MPCFWAALAAREGNGADCLKFLVLTAVRSGEARGARWGEIDVGERVWTIPAARMKGGREHRVPLSDPALAVLEARRALSRYRLGTADLVFESDLRAGAALSDMTLGAVLKRMGRSETVHGFRSSFRDWAAERTAFPREVAEQALAHTIGDKVEAAYRRGDLFEKRQRLMAGWAQFLLGRDDGKRRA